MREAVNFDAVLAEPFLAAPNIFRKTTPTRVFPGKVRYEHPLRRLEFSLTETAAVSEQFFAGKKAADLFRGLLP